MPSNLPVRHAKAIGHYVDDVFISGESIRFDIDFEKSMNKVFGMQPLQHPMGIESVDVEAPQHLPASEVIDDFKQWFFFVTFHESLKKTVNLT